MLNTTLSIIVPIFNGEKTLEKCIKKVLGQVDAGTEIILVDDGSTDRTGEICQKLSNADERVVVIKKENGGVSSARNSGIEAASGKYIMFIDCDDFLEDGYFDAFLKMEKLIDEGVMVLAKIKTHYMESKSVAVEGMGFDADKKLSLNCIVDIWNEHLWNAPFNKIYLRKVLRDNCIRYDCNIKMGEDWLFNNAYVRALKPKEFYFIADVLYDYYFDEDPWRHCTPEDFYENNKRQVEDFLYTLKKLNIDKHEVDKFEKRDLDFTIVELKRIARNHTKKVQERIEAINVLLDRERVPSKIIKNKSLLKKDEVIEFILGNAIVIVIWEVIREKLGLIKAGIRGGK